MEKEYVYIGETSRSHAENIIKRHSVVAIIGEYPDGHVEIGVPANLSERAQELYFHGFERGKL